MFAALSDDDCDAVLRVLKARQGRPGDTLFHEGDPGETLMIVVDGRLEASVRTAGGAQARLSIIEPGHIVGELAFLDAAPRAATVSTKEGATVLEFSRRALLLLCRDQPRLGAIVQRSMLADLARRVRAMEGALSPAGPVSGRAPASAASSGAEPTSMRAKGRPVTAAQLRAVPVLASHSDEDLELLAYMATLRGFARGEVLMREGAEGDAAFLILSGRVDVSRAGESRPVATLEPGALVGQLALLDRARRSATVTATTDATALELKASVFGNLVNASSPLALRFQREVAMAAARHLRGANVRFAASAASAPGSAAQPPSLNEVDGDWSDGSDEPIELGVDLEAIRH
jgi:CRP/FNR family cyclic AMP-dependent transcriptional regulator